MQYASHICTAAVLFFLVACQGAEGDSPGSIQETGNGQHQRSTRVSPRGSLAALGYAGAVPNLDRGASLTGTDMDGNGARDDIDAFIAAKYSTAPQQAAALQLARALQITLKVAPGDVAAAKAASVQVSNAINCVFARFRHGPDLVAASRVVTQLESITANTKHRLLAYLAYNKALDGTASARPTGDTCA